MCCFVCASHLVELDWVPAAVWVQRRAEGPPPVLDLVRRRGRRQAQHLEGRHANHQMSSQRGRLSKSPRRMPLKGCEFMPCPAP